MQVIEQGDLRIEVGECVDGCGTLRLVGEADITSAPGLVRAFEAVRSAGGRRAELDCSALAYLDSSGITALLRGNALLGGERAVRLVAMDTAVRRILDVLGLDQVLDLEDPPAA